MSNPLVNSYYYDHNTKELLINALAITLNEFNSKLLFLCIGSDRHILDCLGPLTGTMLVEKIPELLVYGTLDKPLHAKNLVDQIAEIETMYSDFIKIAIDAAIGLEDDVGIIKFRNGPLYPGKALAKKLPAVGDISITGIVGRKDLNKGKHMFNGSLNHVYHMAQVISEAVYDWKMLYKKM